MEAHRPFHELKFYEEPHPKIDGTVKKCTDVETTGFHAWLQYERSRKPLNPLALLAIPFAKPASKRRRPQPLLSTCPPATTWQAPSGAERELGGAPCHVQVAGRRRPCLSRRPHHPAPYQP